MASKLACIAVMVLLLLPSTIASVSAQGGPNYISEGRLTRTEGDITAVSGGLYCLQGFTCHWRGNQGDQGVMRIGVLRGTDWEPAPGLHLTTGKAEDMSLYGSTYFHFAYGAKNLDGKSEIAVILGLAGRYNPDHYEIRYRVEGCCTDAVAAPCMEVRINNAVRWAESGFPVAQFHRALAGNQMMTSRHGFIRANTNWYARAVWNAWCAGSCDDFSDWTYYDGNPGVSEPPFTRLQYGPHWDMYIDRWTKEA